MKAPTCRAQGPAAAGSGSDAEDDLGLFQSLGSRFAASPRDFANTAALAKQAGLASAQLEDLFRDHAHLTPLQWLRRARVTQAARQLIDGGRSVSNVAADCGFASKTAFERQFFDQMRVTPQDYGALDLSRGLRLGLPKDYRPREILAYQARDPASLSERSEGNRIWKALTTADGPVILELTLEAGAAVVNIHAERTPSRESSAGLHRNALQILGLVNDIHPFESNHAAFVQQRRGLRLPLLPSGFDALCWAIMGQQINLRFASSLRREIVALAGEKIGDMRAHPTPARVADIGLSTLTTRRFSRSKAHYLIGAAEAVARGKLDIEHLTEGSAIKAEKVLIEQHGIGIWTARYVMMRVGFADAPPIGDSGLATALQRLHELPERPDSDHTARLMSRFAPNRSLASMHLWTLLQDAAYKKPLPPPRRRRNKPDPTDR